MPGEHTYMDVLDIFAHKAGQYVRKHPEKVPERLERLARIEEKIDGLFLPEYPDEVRAAMDFLASICSSENIDVFYYNAAKLVSIAIIEDELTKPE